MIDLRQGDCLELMKDIPDKSIDCILTDPPYLYLKNQKLDRPFDEEKYFNEVNRILKDDGFIVLFGRGSSFYRWNTILDSLGFEFKEEIIWEKEKNTSPFQKLLRVHETISIHTKCGSVNKVRVPYIEARNGDLARIIQDIKRLNVCFNNFEELKAVEKYLDTLHLNLDRKKVAKHCITAPECKSYSRCSAVARGIKEGLIERDIIKEPRDYYKMQHPTQKPVRLLERILNIVSKENDVVLDTFMGSGSTGVACLNTNRSFIGFEIDEEYFGIAKERIEEAQNKKGVEDEKNII